MDLAKNNRFSKEEVIYCIPHAKKRKKVPVCEMLESSGSFYSSMLPILLWKLKIIATSSKLELFCQYVMTS